MKKRLLALLLAISALFVLGTACSIETYEPASTAAPSTTVTSEETTEPEETADTTEATAEEETSEATTEATTEETAETTSEGTEATGEETTAASSSSAAAIDENGVYTSCEDVALYIHTYGHLPDNFITKREARDLGWEGGSLEPYAPGMCIGGDRFGNYEGLLPEGHNYFECDIDTLGASSRGPHRIIFSDDGLIYCTEDHYESFTLLYGEE